MRAVSNMKWIRSSGVGSHKTGTMILVPKGISFDRSNDKSKREDTTVVVQKNFLGSKTPSSTVSS